MATTYNNLFLDMRRQFREAGVFDPTRAARELISTGSGKTKEELVRDSRLYVPPEVEHEIETLARRHLAGEPVAYLIGEWEFYGLPLDISRAVLIPRPDTEVLTERAIEAAAGYQEPRVLLAEYDEEAIKICRQNIRRNSLGGRVSVVRADAREKPSRQLGEFDLIVSNPPYIPTEDIASLDVSVRDYEPHLALDGGADGLDFYRAICEKWREALRPYGKLLFEVGIGQADTVLRMMRTNGFGDVQIIPDLNGIPRVVYGTRWDEV